MPPPTAQQPASGLPPEQTTFVGRAAELERLGALLETARLVTVTGTGGVGKTRLALRAAEAAAGSGAFPDGARLVELSGLRDPELLANTVAAVLNFPEQDPRPRVDQVLDYLSDRRLLLILDTCEHLVDACALFAEAVLARASGVTILATSREPLFVAGEQEYLLAPLTVPGPRTDPDGLRALPGGSVSVSSSASGAAASAGAPSADAASADSEDPGDAIELFTQRAAAVAPHLGLGGTSRADLARLCRHLDGIPLAIELAAVQLRDFSLSELTSRVTSRFLDLTRGRLDVLNAADAVDTADAVPAADVAAVPGQARGADRRHQTLRDTIGWSYELCTPAEQTLWERMSVFAGPVSGDAIQQVCAGQGLPASAVLNTLIGLVDKSVLTRTGDGVSRYRMLDTIREYGAERLAATGTEPQVRARHLRHYLRLADELASRPLEQQVPRYQALRAEHADLRAALKYAAELPGPSGDGHPALRLPTRLEWYWVISGRFGEGRHWLTRGLERAPEPGPDRTRALVTRGYLTAYQGDLGPGLADAEEAVALAERARDPRLKARCLVYLAYILVASSRLDEAKITAEKAGGLLRPEDEQNGVSALLAAVRAYVHLLTGDGEGGLRVCEQALRQIPPGDGERWASGYLHGLVGLALLLLGEPARGNSEALRGLAMKQELGDLVGMAHCLGLAALLAGAQQRHERAAWLIGATGPLWKQIGLVFIGVDIMQLFTDQTAAAARASIGEDRYADIVRDAASRPVDQVVEQAVRDADHLPALPPAAG